MEKDDSFPDGREFLAAARLLIDRHHVDAGRAMLCDLGESACPDVSREARRHLSLILKREENWRQAGEIWEMMLQDNPADCFACEELAKWYEHRLKDVDKALNLVKNTLQALDVNCFEERERLRHRLRRLEKRSLPPQQSAKT
jgi:lipopolysaccharide biosynthesis regulator YciM